MQRREIQSAEAGVCKRMRAARLRLGLSQEGVARQIGALRSQIANYEYLRAQVPLDVGLWFCRQFIVGERWLATGDGEFDQMMDLREVFRAKDSVSFEIPEIPFASGYERFLRAEAEKWTASHPGQWWRVHLDANYENSDFLRNLLGRVFDRALDELSPLARQKLFLCMEGAAFDFLNGHRQAHFNPRPPLVGSVSSILTQSSEKRNYSPVIPTLSQLLQRVRVATAGRGSKARLAESLNVPPSRVSEWLSGKAEPSGDTALRLLAWLAEQEKDEGLKTPRNPPS